MYKILCVLLLVLFGCGSQSKTAAASEVKANTSAESKIVFASFLITKQAEKPSKIELISVTESNGKLKKNSEVSLETGDFLTLEISSDQSATQILKIEHPLYKTVEYVNDEHKLTTQYVEANEADFFIRFQKTGNTQIKVWETRKKQPKTELKTFKL